MTQQQPTTKAPDAADARLEEIYKREGATSDHTKIAALAHELRLVGGIARTCEAVTPAEREKYDRIALEAICGVLTARSPKGA